MSRAWFVAALALALAAAGALPEAADVDPALVARARTWLEREAPIARGETVLVLTDRSVDDAVRAAFVGAASQAGATVTELVLEGRPEVTDGLEIARQMRFVPWYPDWLWSTFAHFRTVLELTNLGSGHAGRQPPMPPGTRRVDVPFAHRDQLADPMARGHYPEEILRVIARTVWRQVLDGRRFELKDIEGTQLTWTLDDRAWADVRAVDPARNPDHLSLPAPSRAATPDMAGRLVGSSTHSGPLPRVSLTIARGQVVGLEDGGHVAEYLTRMFAASKDVTWPGFPGPGSAWIEETALGTHPRHARVPGAERLGWSAEMAAWNGAPRAGVFHLAVGTSRSGANAVFAREHGLEVQHLDIELYRPTLVVDGRTVIADGHLLALDDPEVRRTAATFGKADDLLTVRWFPRGR